MASATMVNKDKDVHWLQLQWSTRMKKKIRGKVAAVKMPIGIYMNEKMLTKRNSLKGFIG